MAQATPLRTTFAKGESLQPFYSGGGVAATSDGAWIASAFGADVHVVDARTSTIVHRLEGHGDEVNALALTRDDTHLVVASRSLTLKFYRMPDCALVRTIARAHEAPVALMASDPTASVLATGSADGAVRVWDIAGGYCTHVFRGHGGVISALAWNVQAPAPGSKTRTAQLVTGCVDGKVRVWDLLGGAQAAAKPIAVLSAHAGVVRGIGVAPGGAAIVSGARDQTLVFWECRDGRWHRRDVCLVGERIESVAFVDAHTFYTAGSRGALRLWDVSGKCVADVEAVANVEPDEEDELAGLTDALWCAAAHTIVTVSATQDFAYFALDGRALRRTRQLVGYNDEIVDLAVVHSTQLAVASNNSLVRIYRLDSADHDVALVAGHTDMVLSLDVSTDGRWLVSGSKDRTARVWTKDAEGAWVCLAVCEGHAESVGAVAFARRGTPFVVTASQDRTVKVWDLSHVTDDSREERLSSLTTLKVHDKDINAIDIAPNNGLLLTGSQDRTARVFRLQYTSASHGSATCVLEPLATCRGHRRGIWSVQFSPAEQAFATASSDQTVRMWSLRDFTCVRVFEGHAGSVLRVRYLPGGAQLVSSGNDGLVKVWNVRDEACAATIDAHDDKIWALAVRDAAPLELISGAADSAITFWRDATAEVEAGRADAARDAVEREQEFANLLVLKDYRNAIALAFQLNHPRRLLNLFAQVAAARPDSDAIESIDRLLADALGTAPPAADEDARGSITGLAAVDRIIAELPPAQVVQLLSYIRDWNTSARSAPVAQLLLHALVRLHAPDALLGAFEKGAAPAAADGSPATTDKSLPALLDALMPYTERHYARVDRMLVESAMLEYTLQAMDVLGGLDDGVDDAAGDGV